MARRSEKKESATPVMAEFPTLRLGDTGAYVTVAQSNLINRGYDLGKGQIDGYFGEKTREAVKAFQKSIGNPVPTGIIGPKTWRALQETPFAQIEPKEEIPIEPMPQVIPEIPRQIPTQSKVIIEGLTEFQAEMIVKLFDGGFLCRII